MQYIEAWLGGRGAVPLYNLMEDAATAEISRAQIWQWLYHGAKLDDGRKVTAELFRVVLADEMAKLHQSIGPTNYNSGRFSGGNPAVQRHVAGAGIRGVFDSAGLSVDRVRLPGQE